MKYPALLVLLFVPLSASADTLQVTETVPFNDQNISLSFLWNTANDKVYDVNATGGFALTALGFSVGTIAYMNFTRGADLLQINGGEFGYDDNIKPKPGVQEVGMYELCGNSPLGCSGPFPAEFTWDVTVTQIRGNPHYAALADPVATPEPAGGLLVGLGVILLAGCSSLLRWTDAELVRFGKDNRYMRLLPLRERKQELKICLRVFASAAPTQTWASLRWRHS